jgi:hypothetical protein
MNPESVVFCIIRKFEMKYEKKMFHVYKNEEKERINSIWGTTASITQKKVSENGGCCSGMK